MLALADALERGALPVMWVRPLMRCWALTAGFSVVRSLSWSGPTKIVAVGGSTLGGSGKTPLAVACALELAGAGARVALAGHGYRSRVSVARVVASSDAIEDVGDEALLAARQLEGRAHVVVGRRRSAALALAARVADVVVLDGVAQTSPRRAHLALLAVDAFEPWGRAAALPPRGDLRAPRERLLGACDAVVPIGDSDADSLSVDCPVWPAAAISGGARMCHDAGRQGGSLLSWAYLRNVRVGLLLALARPGRLVRQLARHGVFPRAVVRAPDHGPFGRAAGLECRAAERDRGVELWIASPKCALHASRLVADVARAPLAALDYTLVVSAPLRTRLRELAVP